MDAKKLAGLLAAVVLGVLVIMNASPGLLAWLDVGLIGFLYVIRRRRLTFEAKRYGG